MFTIEQIKTAHARVKSGADFPVYIQDLKTLGIKRYHTSVNDGHSEFEGANGLAVRSEIKYPTLDIADESDPVKFKKDLKEHQQGKTDYLTFCSLSAQSGIDNWIVDLRRMTCTYYDKGENEILVESIPS